MRDTDWGVFIYMFSSWCMAPTLHVVIQRWACLPFVLLTLSHFEGHWKHLTWGWTESSISLELTKTGASGEKLERYGSSVSHGVHASRETQQSHQGSTSHLSLLLSLVSIWINSISFPALIHHKAAYSFTSLVHFLLFGRKVLNWLCVETSLNVATLLLGKYLFLQLLWFFFSL